ncbi:MAG: AlpA family phage regulatory protein [Pseudomonadota bacterium]
MSADIHCTLEPRIIRWPELKKKLGGVSRMTVWRWRRNRSFPAHVQLGENSVGWLAHEVDDWLQEHIEARENV